MAKSGPDPTERMRISATSGRMAGRESVETTRMEPPGGRRRPFPLPLDAGPASFSQSTVRAYAGLDARAVAHGERRLSRDRLALRRRGRITGSLAHDRSRGGLPQPLQRRLRELDPGGVVRPLVVRVGDASFL